MRRKPIFKTLGFFITVLMLFISIAVNDTVVKAAVTDSAATFQNNILALTPVGENGANPDFFKAYTKDLVPGDEVTFAIKLNNLSSQTMRFYFWASDTDFGNNLEAKALSDELLSLINIKIMLANNEVPIYDGPADGKGDGSSSTTKITGTGVSDAITLGWLSAGAQSFLQITISIPSNLGNEYQSLFAAVDWTFLSEIYEVPPSTDPPTTNPPSTDPPTTDPPTTDPPTLPPSTPEPNPEGENIEIEEDDIPEGSPDTGDIDIAEDDIPQGDIIVDDSDLGKLPQTGTLAAIMGNSSGVSSVIFIVFLFYSTLMFIKSRRKEKI
jgi:hypothetical protein